jgi:hypothetical protein
LLGIFLGAERLHLQHVLSPVGSGAVSNSRAKKSS